LYSPVATSFKEITSELKQFTKIVFYRYRQTINSESNEEQKYLISPITGDKTYDNDVWDIDKFVKEFLELKQIQLAYRDTHNFSKKFMDHHKHNVKNRIYIIKLFN